jgi:hypothetical protein
MADDAGRSWMMVEILRIRDGVEATPRDLTDLIALAYRKASSRLTTSSLPVPRQQACAILINGIIDGVTRGLRNVDRLCDDHALPVAQNQASDASCGWPQAQSELKSARGHLKNSAS